MVIYFLGLGRILSSLFKKKKKKGVSCMHMCACKRKILETSGCGNEIPAEEGMVSVDQMSLKVVWGIALVPS